MSVIFLDIDGVLNNSASAAEGISIIPEKVKLIDRIVRETDSYIVISSSWRKMFPLETIVEILFSAGLTEAHERIVGKTPNVIEIGSIRGDEIEKWIKDNNLDDSEPYLIIDDDKDFYPKQRENHLHTNSDCGILHRHVPNAIACLRGTFHY